MNKTAKTLLLGSLLVATGLMLQGCGGCDTTKAYKCAVKEAGVTCEAYDKLIKCYDGCCGETGVKTATAGYKSWADTLSCSDVTDPCA